MRVLGIDPGLSITGYGCVELVDGEIEPKLIEGGVLRLKAKTSMAQESIETTRNECRGLRNRLCPQ